MAAKKGHEGIETRHKKRCASREGGTCNCTPSYQAQIYDAPNKKPIKKTFETFAAAKQWRRDAARELGKTDHRWPTVTQAMAAFIAAMRAGTALNRWRKPYRQSAADDYEAEYERRVKKSLGAYRLDELTKSLLQKLVDEMLAAGYSASTIHNAITPLRAMYRWYGDRHDKFEFYPFKGLSTPVEEEFKFLAIPLKDVLRILDAVPLVDKLVWALAFLAGLRIGEIQALRVGHVDRAKRLIRVVESYNPKRREFGPVKTDAGDRVVPMAEILIPYIDAQIQANTERFGDAALLPDSLLIPGTSLQRPFAYGSFSIRGRRAFATAKVEWRSPHKGRHNFVSFIIDVLNPREAADTVGHSNPGFTLKRYSHSREGSEAERAGKFDALLEKMADKEADPPDDKDGAKPSEQGQDPARGDGGGA